jgi:hypothetical protein
MKSADSLASVALALLVCFTLPSSAQTPNTNQQGENTVYSSSGVTASTAFIDASSFCASAGSCQAGDDFCTVLSAALAKLPLTGAVVDARGVVPPSGGTPGVPPPLSNCTINPFAEVTNPSTVLLPAAFIVMSQTWVLPDRTRIIGVNSPSGASTTLSAGASMTGSMVEMGGPSPTCSGACTGVSVEHLRLASINNPTINGIHNGYSQDSSFVNDVSMILSQTATAGTGLLVDNNAQNSGPYSIISFNAQGNSSSCSNVQVCHGTSCIACAKLQVGTKGLHNITCTGNPTLSCTGASGDAAIFVDASNNSVENAHVEGFWDALEVGNVSSGTVQNVTLTNIAGGFSTSGAVTNTVHLCGAHSDDSDPCNATAGTVNDVTILNAVNSSGKCSAVVQDDITGSTIGLTSQPPNTQYVGMYILGDQIGSGYARFSVNPSVKGTSNACSGFNPTDVPTWQIGSQVPSTCTTPGALYSNTSGTGSAVYVCTATGWVNLF